jgi:hypothetical protein
MGRVVYPQPESKAKAATAIKTATRARNGATRSRATPAGEVEVESVDQGVPESIDADFPA